MLDVIDATGCPTGETEARERIHAAGMRHRTVHVWVVSPGRGILLQRRALEKESHPGLWDVSCAGHIESGMSSEDTAVKELSEELGLVVRTDELVFIGSASARFVLDGGAFIDDELVDVYLVVRQLSAKALVLQAAEVAEVGWVSPGELRKRAGGGDRSLVPHEGTYRLLLDYLERHRQDQPCQSGPSRG
jgi:isopentenyldiphosphate isomerase